jgi:hypothetical protein
MDIINSIKAKFHTEEAKEIHICRSPGCFNVALEYGHWDNKWCEYHYGVYPHNCEYVGCDKIVTYDDEPYCFTHSPDSGSSVRGYSVSDKDIANGKRS